MSFPAAASLLAALALAGLLAQEPVPEAGSSSLSPEDVPATPTPGPVLKKGPRPTPKEIGVGGGSLADIARRNRAASEKEAKKKSLGVISNESLRKGSGAAPTPAPTKAAADKAGARHVVGAPTPTPGIPEPKDFEGRTESDWRRRAGDLRTRLSLAEANVRKLDAEVRRLENDFYAWSDGNYRDRVIKPALDQARADQDKAKRDADDAKTKLDNLEDEARKSGAPPGWIR